LNRSIEQGKVRFNNCRWYTRAAPGPKGPLPTVGWEARREGVDDYRYLQLLKDKAADPNADPKVVQEIEEWFERLKTLIWWHHLPGRFRLLVPENNDFDVMDFYNPFPEVTPEKYDQLRNEVAAFVQRLRKSRS